MIFQKIDFHNVAAITPYEDGYRLWRIPKPVRTKMSPRTRDQVAHYTTGVELRFRMVSDVVTIYLKAEKDMEAQVASIFFGCFQGGWDLSTRLITDKCTAVTIRRPSNLAKLTALSKQNHLCFKPELVRLVLPYGKVSFIGVSGEVEPPHPYDMPATRYLAYGSSITHGSLGLASPYAYPFQIAQRLNIDALNLGLSGACFMEPAMAEYLKARKDWDFATVELGINMLSNFETEVFANRVREFLQILESEPRPITVVSMVQVNKLEKKATQYRQIIAEYAQPHFDYVDGTSLLNNPLMISQDLVHPGINGMQQIAQHLGNHLESHYRSLIKRKI